MYEVINSLGFVKLKIHDQTACESHNLNIDLCSFDNGFKQFLTMISMQENTDHTFFHALTFGTPEDSV